MKRITIISIVLITIMFMSCNDNSLLPFPTEKFSSSFSGKVILQNQTEHSNALVYVDILNRGVSTDSSGNYIFPFTEKDSAYSGEFKIYYFLNDYDMDSAKVMLVKGKVKLDTLNVDSEGKIKTKGMTQMFSVKGRTDKQEYRIGDNIEYDARYTNLTDRTLYFFNGGDTSPLGWVGLYNENYPSIILNNHDPYGADLNIYLKVAEYYEKSVMYKIPSKINYTDLPLPPGEYLVTSGINIYNRYSSVSKNLRKFIFEEWYKIHRGNSPKLDLFPNKYNFPHIKIIE